MEIIEKLEKYCDTTVLKRPGFIDSPYLELFYKWVTEFIYNPRERDRESAYGYGGYDPTDLSYDIRELFGNDYYYDSIQLFDELFKYVSVSGMLMREFKDYEFLDWTVEYFRQGGRMFFYVGW